MAANALSVFVVLHTIVLLISRVPGKQPPRWMYSSISVSRLTDLAAMTDYQDYIFYVSENLYSERDDPSDILERGKKYPSNIRKGTLQC